MNERQRITVTVDLRGRIQTVDTHGRAFVITRPDGTARILGAREGYGG